MHNNKPAARAELSRPIFSPMNNIALAYLSAIVIALIVFGSSLPLYGLFAVCAIFFILPFNYLTGMSAIIVLTMFFERHFALQSLVIDKQIYKLYLLDIVICLTAFSWLLSQGARKWPIKDKLRRLGWPEIALAIWLALVAAWLARSLTDINSDFAVAFSSFKNYFFYPLLYLLFALAAAKRKKIRELTHLYMYAAAGLLVFLVIGVINGAGLWTEFTPLSTAGTRYLAGTHAFYLCLALVMAVTLLAYRRFRSSELPIAIMSLWSLGIIFSLMRHLYLALAASLLSLFFLVDAKSRKTLWRYSLTAGGVVVSIAVVAALLSSLVYYSVNPQSGSNLAAVSARLGTISDLSSDSSASWRAQLWSIAKNEWLKNPLTGSGFGHSVLIETADYQSFEEIRNIHNSPLAILVQMGFVGALSFAVFVLSALLVGFRNIKKRSDPYTIGIFAAAVLFLCACFFQPYLETNLMGIWLWILLGLIRADDLSDD